MSNLKLSNPFPRTLTTSFLEDFNNREYIVGRCEEGDILSIYLNHLSEEASTVRTSKNEILEKGHYYVLKPKTKQHIDYRGEDYYICEVIEEVDIRNPGKLQYYNSKYGDGLIKTRIDTYSNVRLTTDSTMGVTYQSQYLVETNEKYNLNHLTLDCRYIVSDSIDYCYYVCSSPRQNLVQLKEYIQEYISYVSRDFPDPINWIKVIPFSKKTKKLFTSSYIRFETEEEAKKSGHPYSFISSPNGVLYDKECKSYNQKAIDFFTSVLSPEEIEYLKDDKHGYGLFKILSKNGIQLDFVNRDLPSDVYTIKLDDNNNYILLVVQDEDYTAVSTEYWTGANLYSAIHSVTEDNHDSELQRRLKPHWRTLEKVYPKELVMDKRDLYNRCVGVLEDIDKVLEMSDKDIYNSLSFKE